MNALALIVSILIANAAGLVGSMFTIPAIPTWYAGLVKPALSPPAWVFGPVWTALYTLMGIGVFLVWQKRQRPGARAALIAYSIQLALNVFWSILFFGFRSPGAAFGEIIVLWLAILITIVAFAKISRTAAWLLAPYLAWVSFAMYLNGAILALN